MTSSVHASKKDGKYYIHLNWKENGKRKQKCIGTGLLASGNNKREVERMRQRIQREWEEKIAKQTTDTLFSEYLVTWLSEIRHTIEESTYANYKSVLQGVICPYFREKKVKLVELSPHDIQEFYRLKMDRDDISANTIRHYQAYLHRALDYAVKMGLRKDNPADRVELPKKEKHMANFLPRDGIKKLLEASRGTSIETVVRLAVWFGLRRGEILGLKWEDIDFTNHILSVNRAVSRGEKLIVKQPKTPTSIRCFALTEEMTDYFKAVLARQEDNRKRLGHHYMREYEGFVCVNEKGKLLRPDYVSTHLPMLCEKNGLPRIKLHELRHSNISLLLEQGASMKEAQVWAGHSDYSTTANIYAHVNAVQMQRFSQVIEKALTQ